MIRKVLISAFLVFSMGFVSLISAGGTDPAAEARLTISGYVKDAANGESLVGAIVYIQELKTGTSTNLYGFYSISIKPGVYELSYSYLGYTTIKKKVELLASTTANIELSLENKSLEEVVITADRPEMNVKRDEMSVAKLDMKTIKQIPSLMGEVDLIKAIQLLPGVIPAAEGTSAYCVRGGSADQNLVLLDEATVYNASHLMGFFSVFNNDAIRDIKLYKGDIPAQYGGRLASLLEVNMKEGNNKKFAGSGGIGLISSRLTLEGPIVKDKSSFIASGRRTYADLFLPLASDEDLKKTKLYFYDLNLKVNHRFNDNNRLFVSGYFGRDVFKASFASMIFGNNTFTMRWNHLYSQKMFSNLSFVYSKYSYELGFDDGSTEFLWKYKMQDIGLKADYTYYPDPRFTVKYGIQSVYHTLDPGTFSSTGENEIKKAIPSNYSMEHAIYLAFEHEITPKLSLKYGIRYSLFQNIGKGTVYNLTDKYSVLDSTVYPSGKIFNHYGKWEPRVGFKYELNDLTSIKGSYSRTVQYMQMASTSTAGTPLDLWYTASPNVEPQTSDMGALGIFRNLLENMLETSLEVYYKEMNHVIDFKDHAIQYGNTRLEADLRFGRAKSYGTEVMIAFPSTRLNGWVSYTYSHTVRKIAAINEGREYLAPYDKPHTVNVVLSYDLSKRTTIGATWVYATGAPITFPVGRGEYGNVIFPIYTERNTYRMPDYHRLDLSLTLRSKVKPNRWWHGEWNFSIYNAYMRKNVWYIKFLQDKNDPNRTYAEKIYLFSLIPSVTYNFKF
jgi:outer membrane cobalamin receptor